MGLTGWPKGQVAPRKADIAIAKNYLTAEELNQLNLIVAAYLDFAALQATNQRPMYMRDWITKLDQFIQHLDGKSAAARPGADEQIVEIGFDRFIHTPENREFVHDMRVTLGGDERANRHRQGLQPACAVTVQALGAERRIW